MSWKQFIEEEQSKPYFESLQAFVDEEYKNHTVYPPRELIYEAYKRVEYQDVKVLILGQDPYHQPNQAMGLSFSVFPGNKLPKSLVNIFKELKNDLGIDNVSGDLRNWANQGVFLLNALLTVRANEPASHAKKGWETFTDQSIQYLSQREKPIVFILWGKWAQSKKSLIDSHHYIIESSHPSPLGAYRGFWDSKPFSRTNTQLENWGVEPIDWRTYDVY